MIEEGHGLLRYFSVFRPINHPWPNMTDLSPKIIDTTAAISELVELLTDVPYNPPSIYVDLECINLSRHGSINLNHANLFAPQE